MISPSLVIDYSDYPSVPQVPVPASASRYAAQARPRPAMAKAPDEQTPLASDRELDAWAGIGKQAENRGSAAAFVVNELPELKLRAQRAVAMDDPDELSAVTSRIDEATSRFGSSLAPWANIQGAGPAGKRVSELVNQVLSGQYKYEWGVDPKDGPRRTVAQLADDWSPEGVARRSRRISQELDVPDSVARAMFDRNDPKYPVYGRFSGLLEKGAKADPVLSQQARDQQTAYLRSVQRFDAKYGDRFASPTELSEFVEAFDASMNRGGLSAGDSILASAAEAFLGQKDRPNGTPSADEFMKQYAGSVKSLTDPQTAPQDGQPTSREQTLRGRMAVHEAQSLMAAFTKRAAELGVQDRVTTGLYRDTLANAALAARRLNELYGVDLRGKDGASAAVADLALSRLNVDGADSGLARRVDEVTSRVSTLMSGPTRKLVQLKQGQKGNIAGEMVDGANPYLHTELDVVRSAGAAFMKAVDDNGGDVAETVARIAQGGHERDQVLGAIATSLVPRLGRELAADVAGDLVGNIVGTEDSPRMTLEESLRRRAGIPRAKAATVPDENTLSDDDGISEKDVELLDRASVIQSERGNEGVRAAQRQLAMAIHKHEAEKSGEAREKDFDYQKAVGNLYATVSGDADYLIRTGLLGKMASTNSFHDTKHATVLRAVVRGLATFAADENQPMAERAEAMAKLMIAMTSGFDPEEPYSKFPSTTYGNVSTPAKPVAVWGRIRSAARSMNVYLPPRREQYVKSGLDLTTLIKAVPEIAESNLAKSGYLNIHTGRLDAKNMLRVQQRKSFEDPQSNDGRNEELSDKQRAARRALSTFESEDTVVGAAMARHRMHLVAQGFNHDALATTEGAANASLSDAWRNGGIVGVERQLGKLMASRRYYIPKLTQNADKSYVIDQTSVKATDMLTPDEWEEQKRIFADQYMRTTKRELPPGVIEQTQVTGPAQYRDMAALQRQLTLIDARKNSPNE